MLKNDSYTGEFVTRDESLVINGFVYKLKSSNNNIIKPLIDFLSPNYILKPRFIYKFNLFLSFMTLQFYFLDWVSTTYLDLFNLNTLLEISMNNC